MSDPIQEKREIEQSEARHKAAKIVTGLIPGGASAYELFTTLVQPLHEKRRDEWIRDITLRLSKLEEKGKINLKELKENEEFNTVITKATLLAQQNHQEEKIEALKAIVVNSSLELSQDKEMFDWANHFLKVIERISPFHILLLNTFYAPGDVARENKTDFPDEYKTLSSREVFFTIFPQYKARTKLISQCWKELYDLGFLNKRSIEGGQHKSGELMKMTTDFGDKFLRMIKSDELISD